MHVKEVHMARKRPRRSECGREQRIVGVAATDRNKEGFHAGTPLIVRFKPLLRTAALMVIKGGAVAE
jgi:hypothetical protein